MASPKEIMDFLPDQIQLNFFLLTLSYICSNLCCALNILRLLYHRDLKKAFIRFS